MTGCRTFGSPDNLFMPFSRYHTWSEFPGSEFPGAGIGLATTKKIIQRHEGDTFSDSEPGKGASYYFIVGIPDVPVRRRGKR